MVESTPRPGRERDVVLWNPALLDPELGVRASALSEASLLMAGLVSRGLRTICFAKSRKAAELIHRFTSDRVDAATAARLAPYRAGYTPAQRREIERRLMEGELLGVAATDALELGIDIGQLDCAISVGFPGTVASLRQQWGRAGRRGHGLAVLVASEDALDQFFMREPEALLGRRVEATRLDHANPRILDPHVCAAAYEGPDRAADAETLGPEALERAAVLPELERTPAGFVWKGRDTPAARFSLRSGDQDSFTIVDGGDRLGARPRRARARLLDRARGRGLPPPRRAVPRAGARPRRPARRSSSPPRSTGTRRSRRTRDTAIEETAPQRSRARASSSSSGAYRSPSR